MAAVKASDKLELLRLLRKENCDVNADDISGWTALHSAAEHMEDDLVYLLLAFGADPSVENECRMTPYDSAVVAVASRSCSNVISALAASSSSACCFVRRFGRAFVSNSASFFLASMPLLARISSRVRAPPKIELLALVGAVVAVRGAIFRGGRSLGGSEASAIADMF